VPEPYSDFIKILRTLSKHNVQFIIVGGVCAVLHGAPVTTFDLDVVHARDADNLERLLAALHELEAYYRDRPGQKLKPKLSHIASPGHQLLMTNAGPLDLLGTIGNKLSYRDLIRNTDTLKADDLTVRILSLPYLIAIKEGVGRDKDKAVLSILKQTNKEKKKL
jgi:predicted nucleotidyltransferase